MSAPTLRVAELIGSLSLATDLADGFALEKCMRTAVLATRLAARCGASPANLGTTFWSSLLRFTGCTAFAHEEARDYAVGDDIALRRTLAFVDFGRPSTFVTRALRGIAAHAPFAARVASIGRLVGDPSAPAKHAEAQCEAGIYFANTIQMKDVAAVLALRDERWDGRGPRRAAAESDLPLPARIADVADTAELFAWTYGLEQGLAELQRRRGGQLDPGLVDTFVVNAPELFEGVFGGSVWDIFLESEPGAPLLATEDEHVSRVLAAFSRFADLGSVFTLGHSERVADLAARAASAAGASDADCRLARSAGYVHDLGRVAIHNGIWEKPAPLSPYERERIRSHSQHTETTLRLCPALHDLAEVAAATHERGTGRGYHRRLPLDRIPSTARLVAAADVYVALLSNRPHRLAFSKENAERELLTMATAGELDRAAVDAVLAATGNAPARRAARGLTQRELEVVRLVAIGRTNKDIGALLDMSPRTAQKHVMNVYAKLGLESRAGVALFAMEHRLLDP